MAEVTENIHSAPMLEKGATSAKLEIEHFAEKAKQRIDALLAAGVHDIKITFSPYTRQKSGVLVINITGRL